MNRTLKTNIGSFALICALLMFNTANAADNINGDAIDLAPAPDDLSPAVTPPPPFTKFSVFASGPLTTTGSLSACTSAGVTCRFGGCGGCFSFSNWPLKGLAGATISGSLIYENAARIGDCTETHGNTTATGANFVINLSVFGLACFEGGSLYQFTGSYLVLGGLGAFGHAAGTGSFSTEVSGNFETITSSLSMNGTIQKAR